MNVPAAETVRIKVNPKVSYGFTSFAGFALAFAQYIAALAAVIATGDIDSEEIGLLATATFTFLGVAAGRYKQASDAIKGVTNKTVVNVDGSDLNATELGIPLYLDPALVAREVVKSLNTKALVAELQSQQAQPAASTLPTNVPPTTEGQN